MFLISVCVFGGFKNLNKPFQIFNHNTNTLAAHVHSSQFFKDQLFVADLGNNAVFEYRAVNEKFELRLITELVSEKTNE